ncbi:beta strand repeat-containing protein, partial [Simplicispira metamorpha]
DTDAQAARDILKTVTANPASVISPSSVTTALQDSIADATDPIMGRTGGETFLLTTNLDTVDGTAGNDTINVPYVNTLGDIHTTWQAYDSIKGGKGVDTMNIYVNASGINATQASTVESVEIINAYNAESSGDVFGGSAIDAAKFVGAEQIWQIDGNTNIINLASTTTAGFRGNTKIAADLTATADAASINVAFDAATFSGSAVVLGANGAALNAVNLSGVLEAGTTVALDIGASTAEVALKGDFDTTVTFAGNTTLKTLNAAAVNGDVEVNGLAQLTSITTGSGDDLVSVTASGQDTTITTNAGFDRVTVEGSGTAGTGSITIDTGAGNSWVVLNDLSKSISITGGDGNDWVGVDDGADASGADSLTIALGDGGADIDLDNMLTSGSGLSGFSGDGDAAQLIFLEHAAKITNITTGAGTDILDIAAAVLTEATTLTANLGAGDDLVVMQDIEFANIPATWNINAGSGDDDTVILNAGAGRTFVAGDYVALTENLQGFETLALLDTQDSGDATAFNVDASRLTGYQEIGFSGDDGAYNLTKVTSQTIVISGQESKLNINAGGDTAQNLTIEAFDSDETDITAVGNTLDLTVTSFDEDDNDVELFGNLKTVNVTLVSDDYNDGDEATIDIDINHPNGSGGADGNLINLTSVTIKGEGDADINNHAGGALATVDASGLDGSLDYATDNSAVAEAVTLSNGFDWVDINSFTAPTQADALDAAQDAENTAETALLAAYTALVDSTADNTLVALTDATAANALAQSGAIDSALATLVAATDTAETALIDAYGDLVDYFNFAAPGSFVASTDAAAIAAQFNSTPPTPASITLMLELGQFNNLKTAYDTAYSNYDAATDAGDAALLNAYNALAGASDADSIALQPSTGIVGAAAVAAAHGTTVASYDASVTAFNNLFTDASTDVTAYTTADAVEDAFAALNTTFDNAATAYGTADTALDAALADAATATSFGSTVLHTDVITGLNLSALADASDTIRVETDIVFGDAEFVAITTVGATDINTFGTLNLALQAVAQSAQDLVVFQYQGNTYIYGDKASPVGGTLNQLDDTDLLVKLTGTVDLNLLAASLNSDIG